MAAEQGAQWQGLERERERERSKFNNTIHNRHDSRGPFCLRVACLLPASHTSVVFPFPFFLSLGDPLDNRAIANRCAGNGEPISTLRTPLASVSVLVVKQRALCGRSKKGLA
jgi:hypothetical protein